jgi:hypothetical protein
MATFSSDITKISLYIMHHHTALFLCSLQENCTLICLQYNPHRCKNFNSGNHGGPVVKRESLIHPLTHIHTHSTEVYMSSSFPADTKNAQIFHCKGLFYELLTHTRQLFFPCVLMSTAVLNITIHSHVLSTHFTGLFVSFCATAPSGS